MYWPVFKPAGIRGEQKGTAIPHVLTCVFENMKLLKCHLIKTQNCELQCPSLQGAKNKNSGRIKLIAKDWKLHVIAFSAFYQRNFIWMAHLVGFYWLTQN